MKEINAVISPNKLAALREALRILPGFPGMTIIKVEGCSAPSLVGPARDITDELNEYVPKVLVEIVAPDEVAAAIADCIVSAGQTGTVGDGLVWVTDIEQALFIHQAGPDP